LKACLEAEGLKDSTYRFDRSSDWVKMKIQPTQS
jgi:hypothetical protein